MPAKEGPRHRSHPDPHRPHPCPQLRPEVKTYNTVHGGLALAHEPREVFSATLRLRYYHIGDFYTPEGKLRSANDLRA